MKKIDLMIELLTLPFHHGPRWPMSDLSVRNALKAFYLCAVAANSTNVHQRLAKISRDKRIAHYNCASLLNRRDNKGNVVAWCVKTC